MAAVQLGPNKHGKGRVRLAKVIRQGAKHSIMEYNVQVLLTGPSMEAVFEEGDSARVVPTDTVKNTVYCVAKTTDYASPEALGLALGRHFTTEYPTIVDLVEVDVLVERWERVEARATASGPASSTAPHNHAFRRSGPTRGYARVVFDRRRGPVTVAGGLRSVDLLKTTQSAFRGFHKDRFTTLPDVDDRLLGTSMDVTWEYTDAFVRRGGPRGFAPFEDVAAAVEASMVDEFVGPADRGVWSESVQATCFSMGRRVLTEQPGIKDIDMYLPNIHNIPFPLDKYGMVNADHTGNPDIFYPTDEPHGMIHAKVVRPGAARSRL